MRTAGTEIRQARRDFRGVVVALRLVQGGHAGLDPVGLAPLFQEDGAQFLGDHDRVQRLLGLEQLRPVHGARTAALVPAIDTAPVAIVKDRFLDLHLDQLALFLDHDDQVQTFGPFVEALHVQRPDLRDLVGGDAQPFGLCLVDAQQRQRMGEVEPVLARRHEADLGPRLAPDPLVDAVGAGKGLCGKALVVDHPRFLFGRTVRQANVQPAFGHLVILGRDQLHPVRIAIDDGRCLDRVLHRLQTDPEAGKP